MKFISLLSLFFAVVSSALIAQPAPEENLSVKGDISINYRTRIERDGTAPKPNVEDVYTLRLNLANKAVFAGTIKHRPFISNTFGSNQTQQVSFDLGLDVLHPQDPARSENVGKLSGVVPINDQNVYDYTAGTVKVAVFPVRSAKGFESKMAGTAAAKPPARSKVSDWMNKAKERISISRATSAGTATIAITKYDKMDFVRHVLAAGPISAYSEATVDGSLLYDYERSAWYLQDISVTYSLPGGQVLKDRLTGNIRWSDAAGRYDFDVRVNESAGTSSEAAVFSSAAEGEMAFFTVDTSVASLTGSMVYKDSKSGGLVTSSAIKVDLVGNKLTRQQLFYLVKLLLISSIVPLNSDDVDV